MEFFVPFADDADHAERALVGYAKENEADPTTRIYRLVFRHAGRTFTAEVGQSIDRYFDGGVVLAIFYGPMRDLWYVITTNRGAFGTTPIYAGRDIASATPFETPTAARNAPDSGTAG